MEVKANLNSKAKRYSYLYFAISLSAGLLCAIVFQLGLFLIPVLSAALAALYLSESGGRRILSYTSSALVIVFDVIFNSVYSLNCLASVIFSILMYFCYIKNREKSECAVYSTLLLSFFTILSFVLAGFFIIDSFSVSLVASFYKEQLLSFQNEFLAILDELYATSGEGGISFSEEEILLIFRSLYNLITAFVAIFAFVLVGFALKLFTVMANAVSLRAPQERGSKWSFRASSLFAYTYCAAVILSFFVSATNIFGIAVNNFYNVFLFVFAYLGYKYLSGMLARNMAKPVFAKLVIIVATVFLSAFAVQILSFIGAFMTVVINKNGSGYENGAKPE